LTGNKVLHLKAQPTAAFENKSDFTARLVKPISRNISFSRSHYYFPAQAGRVNVIRLTRKQLLVGLSCNLGVALVTGDFVTPFVTEPSSENSQLMQLQSSSLFESSLADVLVCATFPLNALPQLKSVAATLTSG
jgi:hypothetical protein